MWRPVGIGRRCLESSRCRQLRHYTLHYQHQHHHHRHLITWDLLQHLITGGCFWAATVRPDSTCGHSRPFTAPYIITDLVFFQWKECRVRHEDVFGSLTKHEEEEDWVIKDNGYPSIRLARISFLVLYSTLLYSYSTRSFSLPQIYCPLRPPTQLFATITLVFAMAWRHSGSY